MTASLNAKTIVRHELIGLKVQVVKSAHKNLCGICGTVIDETKNTLVIYHKNKPKIIPKEHSTFVFHLTKDMAIEVDGNLITGRPEDRIKKRR